MRKLMSSSKRRSPKIRRGSERSKNQRHGNGKYRSGDQLPSAVQKEKKRIVPTFVGPIGATTASAPQFAPIGNGPTVVQSQKKRIVPTMISGPSTSSSPPPGMISIENCDRRVDSERQRLERMYAPPRPEALSAKTPSKTTGVPQIGIGQEKYQAKLADMERTYAKFADVHQDYDLLDFDNLTDEYETEDEDNEPVQTPKKAVSFSQSKFQQFNAAKTQAIRAGVDEFDWNGATYVRDRWANGVPVWKRKGGKKQGCNLNASREACEADPIGCRFSDKTAKRAAYCAKKSPSKSPKKSPNKSPSKSPKKSPKKATKKTYEYPELHPFHHSSMSHLPVAAAYPVKVKGPSGQLLTLPHGTVSETSLRPVSASLALPGYESGKKASPTVKGLFAKGLPKTKVKGDYDPNFPLPQLAPLSGPVKKKKRSP